MIAFSSANFSMLREGKSYQFFSYWRSQRTKHSSSLQKQLGSSLGQSLFKCGNRPPIMSHSPSKTRLTLLWFQIDCSWARIYIYWLIFLKHSLHANTTKTQSCFHTGLSGIGFFCRAVSESESFHAQGWQSWLCLELEQKGFSLCCVTLQDVIQLESVR